MTILVCVLGQLRYPELTWPHFKKFVIDELQAEFVTCGPDSESVNPYTTHATMNISSVAVLPKDATCTADAILQHRGALYETISHEYTQYVLTRSDLMWYGPHPHLDITKSWFMNCEFHFGISDRHCVLPMLDIPTNFDPNFRNIEEFIWNRVTWGRTTGLAHFPMYLTGPDGKCRITNELDAPQRHFEWIFTINHSYQRNGMFCGRVNVVE